MKYNTLYESKDIVLDERDDGSYMITLFKDYHLNGLITFDKYKIISSSFEEPESTPKKYIKPEVTIMNYGKNEDFYDD